MDDKQIIAEQAEEIRQLKERIAELEDDYDLPISPCLRAKLKPVTAESFANSMNKAREAQERAASASFSQEAFSQHIKRLFEAEGPAFWLADEHLTPAKK